MNNIVYLSIILVIIIIGILYYNKYSSKNNKNYRVNKKPCSQNTKRCNYPYQSNKNITTYL